MGIRRKKVAGVTGLEPAASGVTGQRSNQLSYTPELCQVRLSPVMGQPLDWLIIIDARAQCQADLNTKT